MVSTFLLVAAVIIGIVALFIAFTFFGLGGNHSTTTQRITTVTTQNPGPTNSTGTTSVATTASTTTAIVNYYAINLEYVYTGPGSCNYQSRTQVAYASNVLAGGEEFNYLLQPQSAGCDLTISSVKIETPGFTITSTTPSLPLKLPPYSTADIQINMVAPNEDFLGPLTIQVNDH
ncbi:MAG: hypothetical protein KGH72_02635 [Candidatus Micrarchaeota archaeon]|nr:hypothetical protein [Candidatus Micrarchaeota archaeon]